MNLSAYILEQALRRLQLPEESIAQFQLAGTLSDVDGKGFPKELFQLSAPVIVRGLLNFAMLQMQRDWLYPYWVNKQLDPASDSYIPRAQNPLLINITHRNWTGVGTQGGFHEAIVDPRGLATPLPREWSVDTWLVLGDQVFFPSLSNEVSQTVDANFPCLTTRFDIDSIELKLEHFVGQTNHGIDVLFAKSSVENRTTKKRSGALCLAIRPFNPEGVAPIFSVDFKTPRIANVNKLTGLVFAETPGRILCSSYKGGDLAASLKKQTAGTLHGHSLLSSECERGLAHAIAAFEFNLAPGEQKSVHYSIALAGERELRRRGTKQTWRVSFEKRKADQRSKWEKEISAAAQFEFADSGLQALFQASRTTLLQFNDNDFISPGPFLYHHFWYRDASVMLRALDVIGFHKRVRTVIDAFPKRLTPDGFFRGPDGEWDSNGTVLWSVHQHFLLTREHLWLKNHYRNLKRAGQWIMRKRKQGPNGLMPQSLSAEHLGTVDQYYWDSFWSLGGLKAIVEIARTLGIKQDVELFEKEVQSFERSITSSLETTAQRIGEAVIPATPDRNFDESAIGSACSVYPLQLFNGDNHFPANTVRKLNKQFIDEKGFFHPFVHSGYNPYLTLQLAHSFMLLGEVEEAWKIADTIFRQASPPYSLPEAIHPRTGGGTMGDGHHGWAAAEIILFLRSCMVQEDKGVISLFKGNNNRLVKKGNGIALKNIPMTFGTFSCSLSFPEEGRGVVSFENAFSEGRKPSAVDIYLPFEVHQVISSSPEQVLVEHRTGSASIIRCSPNIRTLFFKL